MKYIILFLSMVVFAMAQRPSYAGSRPIGRPELANRFKDTTEPPTTTTFDVNNRVGEEMGTTEKIPVDARGDYDLVHRVQSWPEENRPFWYLNAQHIEAQRNKAPYEVVNRNTFENGETLPVTPPPHRSPFLPPLNNGRR